MLLFHLFSLSKYSKIAGTTLSPPLLPLFIQKEMQKEYLNVSVDARAMPLDKLWMKLIFFYHHYQYFTSSLSNPTRNKLPFQHHKLIIFCMQAFVFDWFDVRIMLTFSIPSADWNGLFVPLDFLSHTQLHLSCKSIPAASRSGEEKRAVGHQWSSSQRTSGEAVP